jgi:hypothetical protein
VEVEERTSVGNGCLISFVCELGPPAACRRIRQKFLRRGEGERGVSKVKRGF